VIGWARGWGTVYICVADCTSNIGRGASADPVAAAASKLQLQSCRCKKYGSSSTCEHHWERSRS